MEGKIGVICSKMFVINVFPNDIHLILNDKHFTTNDINIPKPHGIKISPHNNPFQFVMKIWYSRLSHFNNTIKKIERIFYFMIEYWRLDSIGLDCQHKAIPQCCATTF